MLEIKNVSKSYGDTTALDDITLTIKGGINFIIGASGSGKTTLLKMIGGMEKDFHGDILYNNQSIKTFSMDNLNDYYYNTVGFIWQDFNLIESLSVIDNIKTALYLESEVNDDKIYRLLRQLKIEKLALEKVRKLSGGQKQRVAIARAIIKNPDVIIADEPTGALDKDSSQIIMSVLRSIAKTKTVIIVTHDKSLLMDEDTVFEIDKGQLISQKTNNIQGKVKIKPIKPKLNLSNAFSLAKTNIKSNITRYIPIILAIVLSSTFLLINVSGAVNKGGQKVFNDLLKQYGNTLLDVELTSSFMSASGTDGNKDKKPTTDVNQDISSSYDKYIKDNRVDFILFSQPFDDIKVTLDGKKYTVNSSGSVPVFNKLLTGNLPKDKGQVVVPQSFVKQLGLSNDSVLGKIINFSGGIYNFDSGNPVLIDTNTTVTIVGVIDATISIGSGATVESEDSFFFSKDTVFDLVKQAKKNPGGIAITLRAKDLKSVVEIADELTKKGIVPLGQFEKVADIVRLNSNSKEQTSSGNIVIASLSIVIALAISIITAMLRKKEYAIYKINGYSISSLFKLNISEYILTSLLACISFLMLSPLFNKLTKSMFSVDIINFNDILIGMLIVITLSLMLGIVIFFVAKSTNTAKGLKSGSRS